MKKIICLLSVVIFLCSCTSEQTQNVDTSPIITKSESSAPAVDAVTSSASTEAASQTTATSKTALSTTTSDSSPAELAADLPDTTVYIDKYGSHWFCCDEEIYISNIESDENTAVFSREYYCADEPYKKRFWKHTAQKNDNMWQITATEIDFERFKTFCYYSSVDTRTDRIGFLKNNELEKEINDFISKSLEEIKPYKESFLAEYEQKLFSLSDYFRDKPEDVDITIINGYLSVSVGYYFPGNIDWPRDWYICKTAVYDIVEGRKIESLSELFHKGFDYENAIRKYISSISPWLTDDEINMMMNNYQFTAEEIIFDLNKDIPLDGNVCNFGYHCSEYLKPLVLRKYSQAVTCEIHEKYVPLYYDGEIFTTENQLSCYGIISSLYLTKAEIEAVNSVFYKIHAKIDTLIPEYNKKDGYDSRMNCWILYEPEHERFTVYVGYFNDTTEILFSPEGEYIMLDDVIAEDISFECEKCGKPASEHWVIRMNDKNADYTCGIDLYDAGWNRNNTRIKA